MAKFDFTEILGQQIGSAPKPKPVPAGTYVGVVEGLPKIIDVTRKDGKATAYINFRINLTEAGDDVDADELEAMGGLTRKDGGARSVSYKAWQDLEADGKGWSWQLDAFLESFGLSASTYTEAFEELPGREVVVAVKHDKDNFPQVDRIYAKS